MDRRTFLQVLLAGPAVMKALPPAQQELEALPPLPKVRVPLTSRPLVLTAGRGSDPRHFSGLEAGPPRGVCKSWVFEDGFFVNQEELIVSGYVGSPDFLLWDPNLPWLQTVGHFGTVLQQGYCYDCKGRGWKVRQKKNGRKKGVWCSNCRGTGKVDREVLQSPGVFHVGEFKIPFEAMDPRRATDARSPAYQACAATFERQRRAHYAYSQRRNAEEARRYSQSIPSLGPDQVVGVLAGGDVGRLIEARVVGKPDPDYRCGADFCDDPACRAHGPKRGDDGDAE